MNLAVNARDAMPKGGKITIRTANVQVAAEDRGALDVMAPGDYVALTVVDTGSGIGEGALSHLFEPFFTTKEKGKGTGLGLSTAFGIIKQSSGFIRVETRLGEGTAFKIFFPRHESEAGAPAKAAPAAPARSGGGAILLVDDEEAIRKMLARTLAEAGYTVLSAADGQEGLEAFQARPDAFALVLTDIIMPRLGGKAMVERIKALRPGLPVLLMSGYTGEANSSREEGRDRFLQKPVAAEALLAAVREELAGKSP